MKMQFPKLRIHVWGGLGSQLFAIALAHQIKEKFPHRNLILVLHTGGVTKRHPEVYELFPEFQYIEVDDFVIKDLTNIQMKDNLFRRHIINNVKALALKSGFLAEENDATTRNIRKWTITVRGHYFHREINSSFLQELDTRLRKIVSNFDAVNGVLHYRLGDLLELNTKNAIDSNRIIHAIHDRAIEGEFVLFSDSPEQARELLTGRLPGVHIKNGHASTFSSLATGARARVFVGTSSKLSYWIALLRTHVYKLNNTLMPKEDLEVFRVLTPFNETIDFY